ncbi:NPC intracellular cholesterol transporter 1 isoform X4 [Vespula squamosa]|uniref:NPC intracellular cholesterol transporter 1 isoform X4 n=1 Tax=Vespula squamosa TaxID=30214 RepID=A0ABD2A5T6_VESSQ
MNRFGVMSRRGARTIHHCSNRSKHNSRNQRCHNVNSPLLQDDIYQQPTTSYSKTETKGKQQGCKLPIRIIIDNV